MQRRRVPSLTSATMALGTALSLQAAIAASEPGGPSPSAAEPATPCPHRPPMHRPRIELARHPGLELGARTRSAADAGSSGSARRELPCTLCARARPTKALKLAVTLLPRASLSDSAGRRGEPPRRPALCHGSQRSPNASSLRIHRTSGSASNPNLATRFPWLFPTFLPTFPMGTAASAKGPGSSAGARTRGRRSRTGTSCRS